MTYPTYAQALELLALHGGRCSVLTASTYGTIFLELERAGVVGITPSGTTGYINVEEKK